MAWKWFWNTETKYYDGEITRDTDWGGDASTDNQPVSGGRVQEWLKTNINGRYGFLNMRFNESESMYYIECFTSEDDYKKYEADKEAYGDLLLQSVQIPISTVEGDTFTATLKTSLKNDANIVVADGNLEVPFNYRSIKISQIGNENANYAGTLVVERSTDGSTWNVVGNLPNVLISKDLNDTETYQKVNIGQFLSQGRQQIRVRATYNYTNDDGQVKTITSGNVVIGASVTRTTLKLELATEYHMPMKPTDVNGNVQNFNVSYRVFGSVQKTLFLKIDNGSELKYEYAASVDSVPQTVQASGSQYLTHGVHKVEAWLQCEDGLGGTITSDKLVNRFMMVADASNTKPHLMLQNVDGMIDNFVQTEVAEYAVYAPNQEKVNVAFLLTTYTTDYETTKPSEYFRLEQQVVPQTPNKLLTTVEIEAENDAAAMDTYNTYFRVRRIDGSTNTDFMKESTNETSYLVIVDNTNAMTPVSGATFLMNPKIRNNNEANPMTILNAKNNNAVVPSEWTNIGLINDGWMTDDEGNKVLRIMAGGQLEIKKNVWAQFRTNPNSSLTFEIDCKISNVTNTTDPIIQMFSGTASTFRGLKMNALEGWLKNGTEQSADDTLFAWQEDVRTHFSFNLNHQVFPNKGDVKYDSKDATKANGSIALARVLVNGDCVRELKYDTTKVDEWSSSDEGSIIIGNEGADIDIYSIRIYENKQLDTIDILTRNYLASLPKADDKLALKQKNDLLDGGLISVEKTKNAKLNTMVWHGILPYKNESSDQNGWIEIFRYDADGNYLADLSGTICKETMSLPAKGQGSTAKTYYDWNVQDDSSKVKATIQVAVKDFHESISVRIDGDQAYIKGGNLGKNFPLDETEVAYPYANGFVTVPDGWIDGNGKYRGMGYMVAYGTALAQKRVIKINYASSMQSHLIGACKTYDLLHRKVVGDTPLQERVPSAVAAKHTEPFMYFNQEGDGNVYFKGMGTYGAGKADKVAWGFVKKEMPMYALIEGSDNNLPMTGFRVPFDKNTAVYDCDGEGWLYNGVQNFDFDLGNTEHWSDATQSGEGWQFVNTDSNEGKVPSKAIRDKWADIHNFIYLLSTNLKFFDGTFEQFKESKAAEDTNYKYWCTQGSEAFLLKRFDFINKEWVGAGLWSDVHNGYKNHNISLAMETNAVYIKWTNEGTGDFYTLNKYFIEAHVDRAKMYLKYFINEKSLQFNYCYVLGFLAGTDNSDKNTYYKIDPIGVQMENSNEFSGWFANRFEHAFNLSSVHQTFMDGDDMDSTLRTDNNSHLTKPYYIDRLHPYADENPSKSLYEGMGNQLFNYVEKAYEGTNELASVMNQIMIAATELIDDNDTKDNKLVGGKSLWGFLNKYFFNIQRYFPQIAYLEQARIRYEFPELLGYISSGGGARSIRPITQSLGSQLQAELQYMNQRVIYMTSYAGFGAWGGDSTHSIGLADANETFGFMPANMPDGSGATYTFTIQPHQYIYPSYYLGQTFTQTHKRTSPKQTCTFTIAENLKDGGDTGIGICGINYISDIGDLKDKSITSDLIVNGKRLIGFVSFFDVTMSFRPKTLTINSGSLQYFECTVKDVIDYIDLSKLIRAKTIIIANVKYPLMPKSNVLKTISFGGVCYDFSLDYVPNLSEVRYPFPENAREFFVGQNVGTNVEGFTVQPIVESIYSNQKSQSNPNLQSIHVENIDWTNFDVEALSWFADRPTCEFKGTIAIKEDHPQGLPRVTWDLKNKFRNKFGGIDTGSSGLKLIYNKRDVNPDTLKIKGNFYTEAGNTFKFTAVPGSIYENTKTDEIYRIVQQPQSTKCSLSPYTGVLTISSLSDTKDTMTIEYQIWVNKKDGGNDSYKVSKTIEIWNRPAQVGDLVYADGTFSSKETYDGEKTVVGRCIYIAPKKDGEVNGKFANPNDKWNRIMVAADDVYVNNSDSQQWGVYPLNSDEAHQDSYSLFYLDDNDARQNLSIEGVSIADIATITNITSTGLTKQNEAGEWVSTSYIDDASYRDLTDEGYENDGFRVYAQNTAVGDGFGADTTGRVLDDTLAKLAGSGYAKGDIVNSSYAKTLKVIHHRNGIISHVQESGEGINGLYPPLDFPAAASGRTELQHLGSLITAVREWAKSTDEGAPGETVNFSKWSQLLYPAASACYAYEPTNLMDGEVLSDKFKAHNWALPTDGILARMFWYTYDGKGYDIAATPKEDSPLDTVTNPKGKVVFKKITRSSLWSVTEYYSSYSWHVYFYNGGTFNTYKHYSYVGRAVAAF